MFKLGILGVGKMGSSILNGIIDACLLKISDICLYTPEVQQQQIYLEKGFNICKDEKDLFYSSEIIFLAIKPQVFEAVMPKALGHDYQGQTIVSIAAGITINYIKKYFQNGFIVRAMPNTPALIKFGATALAKEMDNLSFIKVQNIFNSIGICYEIPESQMDSIVPINGSMPAYLYTFAQAFINKGIADGIDPKTAKELCAYSIIGSARMILESHESIEQLIKNVCSPKGTTLEGLEALNAQGFTEAIETCYDACKRRSQELAKK